MEGVTILSTETINNTGSGIILTMLSIFILLILVIATLYFGVVNLGDIVVLIGGTIAFFIIFFMGISAIDSDYTLQKVLIDDSVSFNEFMENYEIRGNEGDIWKVVPKEVPNDET